MNHLSPVWWSSLRFKWKLVCKVDIAERNFPLLFGFYIVFIRYTSFTSYIPLKGSCHGAFMISVICTWTNGCANNRNTIDFRRHCAHYDVTVMFGKSGACKTYKRPSFSITISDLYCIPLVRLILRIYGRACSSTLLYPRPTKSEGGYTGFTLSVRPFVRLSVCM